MKFHKHHSKSKKFDEQKALDKIDAKHKKPPRKDREFEAPIGSEVPNGTFSQGKTPMEQQIEMALRNVNIDMKHFEPDDATFKNVDGNE
jgi:hypothetical protein